MNHTDKDKKLFSRPLIIGASISAGYGTQDQGPGAVLSRLINPTAQITTLAMNGATSLQSTGRLDLEKLNPSIVLGFDLFFWDAAREQVGAKFEANTRRLVSHFQSRKIPMILGKIPIVDFPFGPRLDGIKTSARKVNALLEELAAEESNTILFDPLECLLSMKSDEYFSDGLHLNREGNKYCAQFLLESGVYRSLERGPNLEEAYEALS